MTHEELIKACRILDLEMKTLDLKVLKERYWKLLKIYRQESLASIPISDELSSTERELLLSEIEQAYRLLEKYCQQGGKTIAEDRPATFNNPLKDFRQLKGIGLKELAGQSGIPEVQLKRLEEEDYTQLPPLVYLKFFLKKIAPIIGVSPEKLLAYYEQSYHQWEQRICR